MSNFENTFERFAKLEAKEASPLYETLSLGIADDDELLALADEAPDDQPAPNLLLAAVQYLLLERPDDPLAAYYQGISEPADSPDEETVDLFREFCLTNREEIVDLLSSRRVQTNLVRRSAILFPVFEHISRQYGRPTLGLVEVGAAAGLNLLWDKYGYDYAPTGQYGDRDSPVQIPCGVLGQEPPFPESMPAVGTRLGIDLNPLYVDDEDDARWLRALVWPELDERRSLLENAITVARRDPPELVRGDAVADLSSTCERVPADETLCILNMHTLRELSHDEQAEFSETVDAIGADRDLLWIWCEQGIDKPEVRLTEYDDGEESTELLAYHDVHGRWIEWQQ